MVQLALAKTHSFAVTGPISDITLVAFGVVGTITPLVDLWVDIRALPDHMRLALKPRGT